LAYGGRTIRKWSIVATAVLVSVSFVVVTLSAAALSNSIAISGDFPNRQIELTRQRSGSDLLMSISDGSSGSWWLEVQSSARSAKAIVEIWGNIDGKARLVSSTEISSVGDLTKTCQLRPDIHYWVTFGLYGSMGGVIVLEEHFLSGTMKPESGTWHLSMTVADAAFDPIRPYVYLTDTAAKSIYFLNTATGEIDKTFVFDWMPESITLNPDSSMMYVALLTRDHSLYWWDEDGHIGYIAVFDLATQTLVKQYQINEDPYDMVATASGMLIVTSGSGQWSYIRGYDAESGRELGNSWISAASHVTLHPSDKIVYSMDTDLSPDNIIRYDIAKTGAISEPCYSPYWGEHRIWGNAWVSPSGEVTVTRGGDVFTSGRRLGSDMVYITSMAAGRVNSVAFDVNSRLVFTAEENALRYYSLDDYGLVGSWPTDGSASFVGIQNEVIFLVLPGPSAGTTYIEVVNGLYHDAVFNAPPVASVTVSPTTGPAGTVFTLDGSASSDPEDPLSALSFRWDFDDDGLWDTAYSSDPVATRSYDAIGTYVVHMMVKDSLGLADERACLVVVSIDPDPGLPGPAHLPFILPYSATDVEFDLTSEYMYVTDKVGKHVFFVNLETGLTEKQFDFDLMPESLTLTPDGSRLFVSLLTRDHDPYWFDEEGHVGYIASFDLVSKLKDRQYMICEDPFDVIATSNGQLVVSGGSGQWTKIRVFRATDGALLSSQTINEAERLVLHPSESIVYAATTHLWPSNVQRFELSPEGVISGGWNSPYHGWHRFDGYLWLTPDGTRMITRGGDVFTAGMPLGSDMNFVASMAAGPITALGFDSYRELILTVEGPMMCIYSATSYETVRSPIDQGVSYEFMGTWSSELEQFMCLLNVIDGQTVVDRVLMIYPIYGGI
jgi:hypothetical protein